MSSRIYWIETRARVHLAILARPRGGDWLADDIAHWRQAGVECALSLLEREEMLELGLGDEERLCIAAGIGFRSFPIPDGGLPEPAAAVRDLARSLALDLRTGRRIGVHCRAGIGRSSLIVGIALAHLGYGAGDALAAIERARGLTVPDTEEQRAWLFQYAATLAPR